MYQLIKSKKTVCLSFLSIFLSRARVRSLSLQVLAFRSLKLRGNGCTLLLRDKGCS